MDEDTGRYRGNGKIICYQGMVFQIILEVYHQCSYMATASMHNIIKPKYAGVSIDLVRKFIQGCPSCSMKNHGGQMLKQSQ